MGRGRGRGDPHEHVNHSLLPSGEGARRADEGTGAALRLANASSQRSGRQVYVERCVVRPVPLGKVPEGHESAVLQ
ncbi:hypothetical protein AEA01_02860 [Xanthomonas campestris pv. campestris]|nr:hypothetical protein AEA01_02860 [Xanthomonas campestris pv. campestris]